MISFVPWLLNQSGRHVRPRRVVAGSRPRMLLTHLSDTNKYFMQLSLSMLVFLFTYLYFCDVFLSFTEIASATY